VQENYILWWFAMVFPLYVLRNLRFVNVHLMLIQPISSISAYLYQIHFYQEYSIILMYKHLYNLESYLRNSTNVMYN